MGNGIAHDRDWIARQIPHAGAMCLLDRVEHYDDQSIRTSATSHRRRDNPMRNAGRLGIAIGIEYAAQTMAVHGALLRPPDTKPKVGYLASVRDVQMTGLFLDNEDARLTIQAHRLSGDDTTILYRFEVGSGEQVLLRGRAAVIFAMQSDIGEVTE